MVAKVVEIVTKEVRTEHLYAVGDIIRKQTEGGPIGSETAQAASRLALIAWDKAFIILLNIL